MRRLVRIAVGVFLLLIAGFCLFGFLASFEPGADSSHLFKAGYGVIGVGCLLTAGWLFVRR
jgi:hypothetical protein